MSEKTTSQLTTKELKQRIRALTSQVNKKIVEYEKKGAKNIPVNNAITRLKELGTGNTKAKQVGLGLTYKRKAELIRQYRELEYFESWDIFTPDGKRKIEAREQKAWESFSKDNPNINYDEWRNMVETFGAIGDSVLNQFGSSNIVELYTELDDTGKTNLIHYMREIQKETAGNGGDLVTPEDMVDRLREMLMQ